VVLRPASEADALWALDQALRCRGVGAVWARWDEFDPRDFRRLQLAAEEGGTVGLLIRSASRRGRPTWAQVQWFVECRRSKVERRTPKIGGLPSWKLHVELVRCPGGAGGRRALLELDESAGVWREAIDAKDTMPATAELADSAPARRA
jgi:protein ImuA